MEISVKSFNPNEFKLIKFGTIFKYIRFPHKEEGHFCIEMLDASLFEMLCKQNNWFLKEKFWFHY